METNMLSKTSSFSLTPSTCPKRHSEFYFEDGSLVIQVENMLFKIFRSTLARHSTVFSDMFELPTPADSLEGKCDEEPVILAGVSLVDFERILRVMYPLDYSRPLSPAPLTHSHASAEEWTSVLSLASFWGMESIRKLAISRLMELHLSPVSILEISMRYNICSDLPSDDPVARWIEKACIDICARREPLSVEEGRKLGLDLSIRLAKIRESSRSVRRPAELIELLSPSLDPECLHGTYKPISMFSISARRSIYRPVSPHRSPRAGNLPGGSTSAASYTSPYPSARYLSPRSSLAVKSIMNTVMGLS